MPPPRDLFVADAREALCELVGALSAVDQMRMALDQPWRNPRAAQIFARPAAVCAGQFVRGAEPFDAAVLHRDGGVSDRVVRIALRTKLQMMPDGLLHR
jgi:hypothetical protein